MRRCTYMRVLIIADAASRAKAEKIRLALEKMREASVQKLFIKAFTLDGSGKSLLVDEGMSVAHVCRLLADKNHVPMDPKWAVVEHLPDLFMGESVVFFICRLMMRDDPPMDNLLIHSRIFQRGFTRTTSCWWRIFCCGPEIPRTNCSSSRDRTRRSYFSRPSDFFSVPRIGAAANTTITREIFYWRSSSRAATLACPR